jgi:transcription initiation factor TFIIH subunit 3
MDFTKVMDQVTLFVNAFLLIRHGNRVAVFSNDPLRTRQLFPTNHEQIHLGGSSMSLPDIVSQHMINTPSASESVSSHLAASLSMALCYANRVVTEFSHVRPRILVVQCSDDASQQYISTMNAIFAAKKSNILIDTCDIGVTPSLFLQQAAHLTDANYFRPDDASCLFQHFVMSFLPDANARALLSVRQQPTVDMRASCFCCSPPKLLDSGWVCPVCLSVFCEGKWPCKTCGTGTFKGKPKPATASA